MPNAHTRERLRIGGGLLVGALSGLAAGSLFDRPSLHVIFSAGAEGLDYSPMQSIVFLLICPPYT